MEDIQVIPSCHDGGMVSLIQSHVLLLVIFASLYLKASVGMYNYPLQILFVYFFDPAIPTSSLNFINCFYTCSCSFFYYTQCILSMSSYMACSQLLSSVIKWTIGGAEVS